ncbi:transmembrane 9 superfamily member 1, partial [Striga asiatica]
MRNKTRTGGEDIELVVEVEQENGDDISDDELEEESKDDNKQVEKYETPFFLSSSSISFNGIAAKNLLINSRQHSFPLHIIFSSSLISVMTALLSNLSTYARSHPSKSLSPKVSIT